MSWMMLGLTLAVLGLQSFYLGCIVQVMYDYSPRSSAQRLRLFAYNRAMAVSGGLIAAGLGLCAPLCAQYIRLGLRLPAVSGRPNHMAVTGLLLLISGFLTFSNTLVIHAIRMRAKPRLLSAEESLPECHKIAS
jgi:hypothetical protein